MALVDYTSLQAAMLRWLARDGDLIIAEDLPDMITLFEAEARRRLYTLFGETEVTITTTAGQTDLPLPLLYVAPRSLRLVSVVQPVTSSSPSGFSGLSTGDGTVLSTGDGTVLSTGPDDSGSGSVSVSISVIGLPDPPYALTYITPEEMYSTRIGSWSGAPRAFTIIGSNFRFAPVPDAAYQIVVDYIMGLPALATAPPGLPGTLSTGDGTVLSGGDGFPLSTGATTDSGTNWLMINHPDCYLFGSLAEAEARIGNDERISLWLQRRDASLESVKLAALKARWGGSALVMRTATGTP